MQLSTDKQRKAYHFAMGAHAAMGQVRKYTLQPYHTHLKEVVTILFEHDFDKYNDSLICAALLHDVIEDTKVDYVFLREEFGKTIADMVLKLTKVTTKEDGDRATRLKKELAAMEEYSQDEASLKLADIISNCSTIRERDPAFAEIYIEEKKQMLTVLTNGAPSLFITAYKLLYLNQ